MAWKGPRPPYDFAKAAKRRTTVTQEHADEQRRARIGVEPDTKAGPEASTSSGALTQELADTARRQRAGLPVTEADRAALDAYRRSGRALLEGGELVALLRGAGLVEEDAESAAQGVREGRYLSFEDAALALVNFPQSGHDYGPKVRVQIRKVASGLQPASTRLGEAAGRPGRQTVDGD